jgi:two-component system phosphate regulon sensor histidine kinase PhoR
MLAIMIGGLMAGTEGHNRGFSRIVQLLIWLVIVPTALLLAVAILMLVFRQVQLNVLFAILVMTLVGCLVTGGVLSLVFLRREAKLSHLQLDFVSKVSHELRTPLTSIRMFAEMLRNERDPKQIEVCLEVLEKETVRLSDRIERLLDWGRMEAGRRVYVMQRDDVPGIVDDALAAFGAAQLGRPVPVQVSVDEGLPEVLADRGALVDSLVNLLSNAVKYGGDDPQIRLTAQGDAREVRISVHDSGPGIPRREHKRIFQKFYRADDRLARVVEGSGLGLAIVRHVAVGHGGRVEVDSAVGEGSTFTVVLPRPTETELTSSEPPQAAAASS